MKFKEYLKEMTAAAAGGTGTGDVATFARSMFSAPVRRNWPGLIATDDDQVDYLKRKKKKKKK